MPAPEDDDDGGDVVIGWDVGGAHVKACRLRHGMVVDVAQWACPLWQGLGHLEQALRAAAGRWPDLAAARHAVTMTGEMVDLFPSRQDGVRRIAALLMQTLAPDVETPGQAGRIVRFFAGHAGWCSSNGDDIAAHWSDIASANWLATACHAAERLGTGVLVDIGSTTTDLVAFAGGKVPSRSRTDADRLASGELVYHGVVRTPLCAVAPRIGWRGAAPVNVMNEFFATTADVYRLTGELDPGHDLQPSADAAPKDPPATRQRLARMIGLDRADATDAEWLGVAAAWRAAQVAELGGQLRRIAAAHGIGDAGGAVVVVGAGCGDFLVADVAAAAGIDGPGMRLASYGRDVARIAPDARAGVGAGTGTAGGTVAAWAQVCAPCVAVATLLDMERR